MTTSGRGTSHAAAASAGLLDVAVILLDAQGVVAGWSAGAQQVLGHTERTAMGRRADNLLAASALTPEALSAVTERTGTVSWRGVLPLRHRDGHEVRVATGISRLALPTEQMYWLVTATLAWPWSRPGMLSSLYEDFLVQSPVAIAVLDNDLRYVWVNGALERGGGVTREQAIGRRWGELQPGLILPEAHAYLQRALKTGKPVINHIYHGRVKADPFHDRAFAMSAFRLEDAVTGSTGLGFMTLDVTDHWRARTRLMLLNEAGSRLGRSLDPLRTAQEVCDLVVPGAADCCTVDLWDWVVTGQDPVRETTGEDVVLMRAGQLCSEPTCWRVMPSMGEPVTYKAPSSVVGIQATGRPVLASESELALIMLPVGNTGSGTGSNRPGSAMVVPLRVTEMMLGVAVFVRHNLESPFDNDDLFVAEEIAARAALCLENARRYTREHSAAVALQHSLLPHDLAGETTLEIACRYLPAHAQVGVGGDWFDVIPLSGSRTALVVGDVSGHGIQAAATMGRLRSAVHTLAAMDLPPDEILARLDDLVLRLADRTPPETESLGATCLCLIYDPVSRQCTMATAGHPPPVLICPGNTVVVPELPTGPALGVGGLPFESTVLELPDDTLVVLYTDGLLHAYTWESQPGLDRFVRQLTAAGRLLEDICDRVINGLPAVPPSDDVVLLMARTRALDADQTAEWELKRDPAVVSQARTLVNDKLDAWDLDDLQMTTELIVSEMVTNAIRYGAGTIRLRLVRSLLLICEVSDESSSAPHLRHARTTDEGGRGLFIIAQIARRWGTRPSATGKTIWAEQDLPPTV
ncbi:SpoIIE family protein phosphatase [Streptomyces sp. NPDC058579]|uniref:SpoIIE family protein phosphatase n=1 Tax=Streptomyces sp. NPDC058579 TaxID=3346548 RepID=UPI003661D3D3